jgi:hypothetical protein
VSQSFLRPCGVGVGSRRWRVMKGRRERKKKRRSKVCATATAMV